MTPRDYFVRHLRPFALKALEPASRMEVWVLYAIAVVLLMLIMLAGGVALHKIDSQGKHSAALVQGSREEATLRTCEEGNDRHDGTLRTLNRILKNAEAKVPPAQRPAIRSSRAPTELLIRNLAPRYDCHARVKILTRQHGVVK